MLATATGAGSRPGGPIPADRRDPPTDREGVAQPASGPAAGGERHGQGSGRPRHPRRQSARPVRAHRLRLAGGNPDGKRALRPRQGRIQRRRRTTRRDWWNWPTAARPSSTRSATCRWKCRSNCCACCRRANSAPVGSLQWRKVDLRIIAATHRNLSAEVAAGPLPPGPLLPPQRLRHATAAAAPAQGGHSAAGGSLPERGDCRPDAASSPARNSSDLSRPTTGRATSAS